MIRGRRGLRAGPLGAGRAGEGRGAHCGSSAVTSASCRRPRSRRRWATSRQMRVLPFSLAVFFGCSPSRPSRTHSSPRCGVAATTSRSCGRSASRRRQSRVAIAWQATLIAVAGVVIGLPLGIIAGRTVWRSLAVIVPDGLRAAARAGRRGLARDARRGAGRERHRRRSRTVRGAHPTRRTHSGWSDAYCGQVGQEAQRVGVRAADEERRDRGPAPRVEPLGDALLRARRARSRRRTRRGRPAIASSRLPSKKRSWMRCASSSKPIRAISSVWKLRRLRAHAADVEAERRLDRPERVGDVVVDVHGHVHRDLEAVGFAAASVRSYTSGRYGE